MERGDKLRVSAKIPSVGPASFIAPSTVLTTRSSERYHPNAPMYKFSERGRTGPAARGAADVLHGHAGRGTRPGRGIRPGGCPASALGRRLPGGDVRPQPLRPTGLAGKSDPLRRAPRPDHRHRDRRIARVDRLRSPLNASECQRHHGGGARSGSCRELLARLLRLRLWRHRTPARPASGEARVAFARDAYTYLHLPMVAGILLFGFAMRTTLAHVSKHLPLIPALALCCGSALYLLAFVALRWRASHTLGYGRPIAGVVLAALTPVAVSVSALVASAWLALHAYELIWWRAERSRRRARGPTSQPATDQPREPIHSSSRRSRRART